jgi:hypothetical protein
MPLALSQLEEASAAAIASARRRTRGARFGRFIMNPDLKRVLLQRQRRSTWIGDYHE